MLDIETLNTIPDAQRQLKDSHGCASVLTPTRTAKFLSISLEVPSGLSPKKPPLTDREGRDGFPSPILFKQEASQTLQMQFSPTGEEHKRPSAIRSPALIQRCLNPLHFSSLTLLKLFHLVCSISTDRGGITLHGNAKLKFALCA